MVAEKIRVNCVRPGIIDTDIHASGGLPDRVRDVGPTLPMGRVGTSEEVADAVLLGAGLVGCALATALAKGGGSSPPVRGRRPILSTTSRISRPPVSVSG